jgi:hypothetical protein
VKEWKYSHGASEVLMSVKTKYFFVLSLSLFASFCATSGASISVPVLPGFLETGEAIYISQDNNPDYKERDIYFGFTKDAPPVSFISLGERNLSGYCANLRGAIESFTGQKIPDERLIPLDQDQRFEGFARNPELKVNFEDDNGDIGIECGPSTKTKLREEKLDKFSGYFSDPFLITGTKLLLKKENRENLYKKLPFSGKEIGVLGATTTNSLVEISFSAASFTSVSDRFDAKEKLEDGEIAAYASDEVLLRGIVAEFNSRNEIDASQYTIEPRVGQLSYDEYAIVIYNSDDIGPKINNWIEGNPIEEKKYPDSIQGKVSNFFIDNLSSRILPLSDSWSTFLFVSFLVVSTLLVITHPWFISLLAKLTPVGMAEWVSRKLKNLRAQRRASFLVAFIDLFLNEITVSAFERANKGWDLEVDGHTLLRLLKTEVGLKSRLDQLSQQGFENQAIEEKVANELASEIRKDSQATQDLMQWLYSLTDAGAQTFVTETSKRIVESAFRLLGRPLNGGND